MQAAKTGLYRVRNAWYEVVEGLKSWVIAAWSWLKAALGSNAEKCAVLWGRLREMLSQILSQMVAILHRILHVFMRS